MVLTLTCSVGGGLYTPLSLWFLTLFQAVHTGKFIVLLGHMYQNICLISLITLKTLIEMILDVIKFKKKDFWDPKTNIVKSKLNFTYVVLGIKIG